VGAWVRSMNFDDKTVPSFSQRLVIWHRFLFLPNGATIHIEGVALRSRLTRLLLDAHSASPGRPVETQDIARALWPGDELDARCYARVKVAVCRLRAAGLPILTLGNGYALDARVVIRSPATRQPALWHALPDSEAISA
jgi:hypothetical protein